MAFDFKLENIEVITENAKHFKLALPPNFSEADFIDKAAGIGDDVDMLIGNVVRKVRTDGANRYFQNLSKNYKKSSVNLKLKTSANPIVYEEKFDYNTSQGLNVFFGNISNSKDIAYLFRIIELSNVYVNDNDIDTGLLRESVSHLSEEKKEDLYIITGVTNFYLEATAYEESNLKGGFDYAFSLSGSKYSKTSQISNSRKIAVTAIPLKDFLSFK